MTKDIEYSKIYKDMRFWQLRYLSAVNNCNYKDQKKAEKKFLIARNEMVKYYMNKAKIVV